MTIAYFADDGTRFDNKAACEYYEFSNRCKIAERGIIGRNEHGDVLSYSSRDFFGDISFITCKTDEAVQFAQERAEREGYDITGIDAPGTYYFNDKIDAWDLISNRINELNIELTKMELILNDFQQ